MGNARTKKIRDQIGTIAWGIRHLWHLSPGLMTIIIFTGLLGSLLPAGLALATRSLINSIAESMTSGLQSFDTVLPFFLATVSFVVLQSVHTAVSIYYAQIFRDNVNLKVSGSIMDQASRQDISFFEVSDNLDMHARVQQNTSLHLSMCFLTVISLLSDFIKLVSLTAILVVIEPIVAIIIIPIFIPYLLFKINIAKDKYNISHNRMMKRRWTTYFVGLLTHPDKVAEIRILGIAQYLLNIFNRYMSDFFSQDRSLYKRVLNGNLIFSITTTAILFLILARVIVRSLAGAVTIGDVVIFIGTTNRLRTLLENTTQQIGSVHEHSLHIESFRDFLQASHQTALENGDIPEVKSGAIDIKNVTFTYPGTQKPTLSNISLAIQPGEIIAFVGENAAGKTTLAKIIAGLYKVESGEITIDGYSLSSSSLSHIQQKIAFVFQDVGKYEATAHGNIAMGDWKTLEHDRERVEAIARDVDIHDFIETFPQGYNTLLGKRFGSHNPSGGQWQNIAIARAFARNSVILILDEPTANLSARGEYELFKRFRKLAKGRTTILISHRFSTVKIADRIVMLKEGQIIETGTHKELVEENGAYAALFNLHQKHMAANDIDS